MSSLLSPFSLVPLAEQRRPNPLFLEFPVPSATAPYLVTGTRTLLWIQRAPTGALRAALRAGPWDEVKGAPELVRECFREGVRNSWGNTFPGTLEGMQAACGRMKGYDLTPLEVLINSEAPLDNPPDPQAELVRVPWVPRGCAVVVPKDRGFLGTLAFLGEAYALVVHNPARGLAVVGSWGPA